MGRGGGSADCLEGEGRGCSLHIIMVRKEEGVLAAQKMRRGGVQTAFKVGIWVGDVGCLKGRDRGRSA